LSWNCYKTNLGFHGFSHKNWNPTQNKMRSWIRVCRKIKLGNPFLAEPHISQYHNPDISSHYFQHHDQNYHHEKQRNVMRCKHPRAWKCRTSWTEQQVTLKMHTKNKWRTNLQQKCHTANCRSTSIKYSPAMN
jgi:hypothetical protein